MEWVEFWARMTLKVMAKMMPMMMTAPMRTRMSLALRACCTFFFHSRSRSAESYEPTSSWN